MYHRFLVTTLPMLQWFLFSRLGALQGAKLYYDFSNMVEFEGLASKLIKELGNRGKMPTNDTPVRRFDK